MVFNLWAVLVLFTIFALANAFEQRSAVGSATQLRTSAQAHARKSKRSSTRSKTGAEASLRGLGITSDIAGDDNDQDDEDDEEDDAEDKTEAATPTMAATPSGVQTLNSKVSDEPNTGDTALHNSVKQSMAEPASELEKAAEEKKTEKVKEEESIQKAAADEKIKEEKEAEEKKASEEEAAQKAVEAAKAKAEKAKKTVKSFSDDEAFDEKIDIETMIMTNETQSPALANFLGELRTEVRDYAMPTYPAYLQTKLDAADKKVLMLESELKKQEGSAQSGAESEKKTAEGTQEKKSAKEGGEKVEAGAEEVLSGADLVKQKAGETFALSFFSTIAMLAIVFAMATSEDKVVNNYTWFLVDQVIAIFLAVMYFQAFDSFLNFHALGAHSAVLCSILHAVVMLAIVLCTAAALRKKKVAMAILCSAGAHVVSFSSIHAAAGSQNKWIGMSYTPAMCVFGMCTILVALIGIGFISYTAKRRTNLHEDQEYMEKTEDIENDFAAMALSVVFTMFVRFVLTGHHPADDETEFGHTQNQRNAMGLYAIVCLIAAAFVTTFCAKKAAEPDRSDFFKRLMTFFTTVATMNVAWAVLYWGEWEFFEALYPDEAIKGRLMFAIAMTMFGGLGLFGLSKVKASPAGTRVALIALSLVVAWSWELCFDSAMEAMCEGVSHPVGWKIATTLILAAIVVPVYGFNIKPISSKAAEAIGA